MEFDSILAFLSGLSPVVAPVLAVVGLLVVLAEVVVVLTPSKKDDEAWAKIKAVPFLGPLLSALVKLAPIQKK